MNKLIKTVLLASSSQMGFNWIYNSKFLEEHSKTNEMLMKSPVELHYQENKPSYFAYPNSKPGDVTLQGEVLKWLYNDWQMKESYSPVRYKRLLLNHLMPGGSYSGYVESYGNKLVLNELNKKFNLEEKEIADDQLVGFVPLIVARALNKPLEEALSLTNVLTNNEDYKHYFNAISIVLDKGKDELRNAVSLMPEDMQDIILKAISTNDASEFIKSPHDLSCSIDVAMPLIFHLYNKHDTLLDALKENVILGGASGDRALLLGLLFYPSELPQEWDSYLEV